MLDQETQILARSLYKFIKKKFGFKTKPNIKFKYSASNAHNHLGYTGHYDPETETIVIFCMDRHPKDILRSLAHELMHHVQKHEGSLTPQNSAPESDPNYIVHNKYLEGIEADAFERGNVAFRFWEAEQKMDKKTDMKERHLTSSEKSEKEKMVMKLKKKGLKGSELYGTATNIAKGVPMKHTKEESVEENVNENQEQKPVDVNEALKDSLVYVKDDRACNDMYNKREEAMFQDLLKKFGIKK